MPTVNSLDDKPMPAEKLERSETFARGLRVVDYLARIEHPQTVAEIAKALSMSRQAVYRLLNTLGEFGYLKEDLPSTKFALNLRLLSLGRQINSSLREYLTPLVRDLAEESAATAFVGISEGDDVVCLLAEEPRETLVSVKYREGIRRPKHLGASGKIIRWLENPSVADPAFEQIRAKGYATSTGELEEKTSAISAPLQLLDASQKACLTLIFPQSERPDRDETVKILLEASRRISSYITY